jgi:hypothetical protein
VKPFKHSGVEIVVALAALASRAADRGVDLIPDLGVRTGSRRGEVFTHERSDHAIVEARGHQCEHNADERVVQRPGLGRSQLVLQCQEPRLPAFAGALCAEPAKEVEVDDAGAARVNRRGKLTP